MPSAQGDIRLWNVRSSWMSQGGTDEPLTAYLAAARGALSPNTERALRADVEVFRTWCRRHFREAFPASPATVAAFVDEMARVRTPATVRRYVSSIAALHKALRQTSPLESPSVRFPPCSGCTAAGGAGRPRSRG